MAVSASGRMVPIDSIDAVIGSRLEGGFGLEVWWLDAAVRCMLGKMFMINMFQKKSRAAASNTL